MENQFLALDIGLELAVYWLITILFAVAWISFHLVSPDRWTTPHPLATKGSSTNTKKKNEDALIFGLGRLRIDINHGCVRRNFFLLSLFTSRPDDNLRRNSSDSEKCRH